MADFLITYPKEVEEKILSNIENNISNLKGEIEKQKRSFGYRLLKRRFNFFDIEPKLNYIIKNEGITISWTMGPMVEHNPDLKKQFVDRTIKSMRDDFEKIDNRIKVIAI
jgi:hypothetical protein